MKKFLFLFIIIFLTAFPKGVSAHILETNGTVGGVLHIDPDDDPIVGKPAYFFLDLKDKSDKFVPQNCVCTVTIQENGKQVFLDSLFKESFDNASFTYSFPKRDIYIVRVDGKPTNSSFQPFSLTYTLRITRTENISISEPNLLLSVIKFFGTHIIHFLIAIVIFIFAIIALIQKYIEKRR